MRQSMINDLLMHHRDRVLIGVEDIYDTCKRVSSTQQEGAAIGAYITIRVSLMVVISTVHATGGNKEEFLKIASQYWDTNEKIMRKLQAQERKKNDR